MGRYRILRPLGQGGMAEVYLARVRGVAGFRRLVVIKRIRADRRAEARYIKMFIDEAHLAAALNHPNLVSVLDFGADDDGYFQVMNHVPGCDLRVLQRQFWQEHRRFAPELVAHIGASVAAGLSHAHTLVRAGRPMGLVHRDVSPQNILLGMHGEIKLSDFGIAFAHERLAETTGSRIKGKLRYLSPEQARGDPLDGRSDLFSLGVVLLELFFTHQVPVEGLQRLRHGVAIEGLWRLAGDVPGPLREAITGCLQRDPDRRPATAALLSQELAVLAHGLAASPAALRWEARMSTLVSETEASSTGAVTVSSRPGWRRRLSLLLFLFSLGVLGWWAGRGAEPESSQAPGLTPTSAVPSGHSPPSVPPPSPVPVADSVAEGRLLITAVPYGKIWVDGALRGDDQVDLRVGVGVHRVLVENPYTDRRVSRRVSVADGERKVVTVDVKLSP